MFSYTYIYILEMVVTRKSSREIIKRDRPALENDDFVWLERNGVKPKTKSTMCGNLN